MTPFWRRVFRVSHWTLGVVLALFLLIEALTGSVLLYQDAADRVTLPALHAVQPCVAQIPVDALVQRARAVLPSAVTSIDWDLDGAPDTIRFSAPNAQGERIAAYLNPCDGCVEGVRPWIETASGLATELHATLMLGALGHVLVFVLGFATFALALSGVVLWPGWKKAYLGFRFRRSARTFAQLYDTHVSTGIVFALALGALALTGTAMAQPDLVQSAFAHVLAERPPAPLPRLRDPIHRRDPMQRALEAVRARIEGARVTELVPAKAPNDAMLLYVKQTREADEFGSTLVYADAASGKLLRIEDGTHAAGSTRLVNAMLPLHMGTPYGLDARPVMLVVAAAMLAMIASGIWMRTMHR